MLCRTTMKKLLLIALLIAALTGCNEKNMNNELKPFDVQKEFADNGFTFFTKNLILCSGDTTENNAMTIGWGGIGNYLGHDRPAVTVYVAPARYTWEFMERYNNTTKDWYADFDAGIHTVYIGEVIGSWRR